MLEEKGQFDAPQHSHGSVSFYMTTTVDIHKFVAASNKCSTKSTTMRKAKEKKDSCKIKALSEVRSLVMHRKMHHNFI